MKKNYLVIIIMLAVLVLGLGGYIVYDKFINDDNNTEEKDDKNKNTSSFNKENDRDDNDVIDDDIDEEDDDDDDKPVINHSASLKVIELTDLKRLVKNEEDFVIMYSQTTCGHCTLFKPVLEEIVKEYKIEILVLEINLLNEEEFNEFMSISSVTSTPVLSFFDDGKEEVSQRLVGSKTKEEVITKLKKLDYIDEDDIDDIDDIDDDNEETLDNFVGMDYNEAKEELEEDGFNVIVSKISAASLEAGTVIRQSPSAGEIVKKGDTITLYISD